MNHVELVEAIRRCHRRPDDLIRLSFTVKDAEAWNRAYFQVLKESK